MEVLYENLDFIVKSTPMSDKLIILGDFKSWFGDNHSIWDGVLGSHGLWQDEW